MSDIFSSVVDTGEDIFDIVAHGVVDLTNDTANVVHKAGGVIVGIFDFVGGPSVFGLYAY